MVLLQHTLTNWLESCGGCCTVRGLCRGLSIYVGSGEYWGVLRCDGRSSLEAQFTLLGELWLMVRGVFLYLGAIVICSRLLGCVFGRFGLAAFLGSHHKSVPC